MNTKREYQERKKKVIDYQERKILVIIKITVKIIFLCTDMLQSQPSFTSNLLQASIEDNLGLLAAAGGVYAYYKLRVKRNEDELE